MKSPDDPPEGFVPAALGGAFATHNGPFYARWHGADGAMVLRASGVFRRGPLLPDSASDGRLRLPGMPERG